MLKQEGDVRLDVRVVRPFSLIIKLIQPIKSDMAMCQSLQGICNHDSRLPLLLFKCPFFSCIIFSPLWHVMYSDA